MVFEAVGDEYRAPNFYHSFLHFFEQHIAHTDVIWPIMSPEDFVYCAAIRESFIDGFEYDYWEDRQLVLEHIIDEVLIEYKCIVG
jgi:hypothetical protein